jgi:TPR repeat protein
MGCPEGFYGLTAAHSNGWGVPKNQKKAKELLKLAAERGALNAMVEYGMNIYDEGKEQEGIAWLEKSLALGNGDAAANLALLYERQKDIEGVIRSARKGCKLGSLTAIAVLAAIYLLGRCGQEEDREYALRLNELSKTIDTREQAKPIPDFDERIPPKPILPFK